MVPLGSKRFNDFLLILILFLSVRMMMLLVLPAESLTLYGDYRYYFDLGALLERGYWPFIHYWSEYPPVFPFFNLILYELSGGVFKNYVTLTGLVLLAFEAGILILLYLLAVDLGRGNDAVRVSWIYVMLYAPIFIWLRQYDAIAAFLLLLALLTLQRGRFWLTGLIIGLGTMAKLLPIILLATVWRAHGRHAALISGLIALLVVVAILAPLLALSPDYTLASLLAQPSKSSWQTVWALIDGNTGNTGNFGPVRDHLDPTKATETLHNPSRLPPWLTLIPFALLGWFIFTRPPVRKEDGLIFTTLALAIFFLWVKGWSPQWQIFLFPLLLLSLPPWRAVMFVLTLSWVNLLEWPVILSRGLVELLPLTVIIRTLVLGLLAWELYRQMNKPAMPETTARQ
jgi:hypothetical protein